jgi:hypothetical protein
MTVAKTRAAARTVISDKAASLLAPATAYAFKGKNAALRGTALKGIASLAYSEGKSRGETITQTRLALGAKPSPAEVEACKVEYLTGRVAQRLNDAGKSIAEQLARARSLITQHAAPAKDGAKANKLRKGQIGRRTPAEHGAVRAAESAWSLMKADLGLSDAKGMAAKKRAPSMKGSGKGKAAAPSHGELVKSTATAPKDAAEFCAMVAQLTASLLGYANKHAGVAPAPYGMAIKRFHGAIAELEKARAAA